MNNNLYILQQKYTVENLIKLYPEFTEKNFTKLVDSLYNEISSMYKYNLIQPRLLIDSESDRIKFKNELTEYTKTLLKKESEKFELQELYEWIPKIVEEYLFEVIKFSEIVPIEFQIKCRILISNLYHFVYNPDIKNNFVELVKNTINLFK